MRVGETPNILIAPVGRDGCSFNRITQPYQSMHQQALTGIKFLKRGQGGDEMLSFMKQADVLVMRPGHESLFDLVTESDEFTHLYLIVDLDDDLWDITPFAQTYRYLGTENIKYGDEWLWKDGENGFDLKRNQKGLDRLIDMLTKVDMVTVSTERLKKHIEERTGAKNVRVVHNQIDFYHWKKLPLKKSREFKIGWSGGATHYIDWFTIKDVLPEVITKGTKLILQGCKWGGTIKGLNYEFHDWVDNEAHPYKVATYGLDMGIIPLKDTDFNKYKSCIKWYELSALKVPCVVANVPPYSDEVRHGVTGFLYNTPEEFVKYSNILKDDPKLRKEIADNAYEWVKKNRNVEDVSKKLYNTIYEQVK